MPLHRVPKAADPAGGLQHACAEAEKAGETVVQVLEWADEWLLITHQAGPCKKRPPVETRARNARNRKETRA